MNDLILAAADQDKPLTADEARALDLLMGFDEQQLEIMIKILDLAFGGEK